LAAYRPSLSRNCGARLKFSSGLAEGPEFAIFVYSNGGRYRD
jgi:hypothetical protein